MIATITYDKGKVVNYTTLTEISDLCLYWLAEGGVVVHAAKAGWQSNHLPVNLFFTDCIIFY